MNEWRRATLFDAVRLQRGFDLPQGDRRVGRVPVVASTSIVGYHDEAKAKGPGVVIGRSGSIGGSQWMDGDYWPLNTTLWVKDFRGNDPKFIYYLFRSIDFARMNVGTGVPTLNRNHLTAIEVGLPPLEQQKAIAAVLEAIDAKIETNDALVAFADELLRSRLAFATATAGSAWTRLPLTKIARFVNGGAFTKGASGSGRIVIRIRELNVGVTESTVFSGERVPGNQEADAGDILFAWSGSLGVYRWRGPNAIVNQHIFKVVPDGTPPWFVYARLLEALPSFQAIARDKATTMGHIQRSHLDDALVVVPPPRILSDLDAELAPMWEVALATEAESETLRSLSGVLLPELVSGRVSVRVAA